MPEVVYPTPDEKGKSRNWADVFPIWGIDEASEWPTINSILEGIAMNNRFGGKTAEEYKAHLIEMVNTETQRQLDESLAEMLAAEGEMTNAPGGAKVKKVDKSFIDKRVKTFGEHGLALWYIDQVFANLGGAYREFKK